MFTSSPLLAYYELPRRPRRVTTDASKSGLGTVLEQNHAEEWKPVAFLSRAMTQWEQHYAQIEKETLAIVFACERFHEYIYCQRVIVRSDHKLLKGIFSKQSTKHRKEFRGSCYGSRDMIFKLNLHQETKSQ